MMDHIVNQKQMKPKTYNVELLGDTHCYYFIIRIDTNTPTHRHTHTQINNRIRIFGIETTFYSMQEKRERRRNNYIYKISGGIGHGLSPEMGGLGK